MAREFGVPLSTIQFWIARAGRQRLDRVDWSDRPSGVRRPQNRTLDKVEERVLKLRRELHDKSALGEWGAKAIHRELTQRRKKVAEAIRVMDTTDGPAKYYPGGRIKFEDNGRRAGAGIMIIQWQNGEPVTVYPTDIALAKPVWPKK